MLDKIRGVDARAACCDDLAVIRVLAKFESLKAYLVFDNAENDPEPWPWQESWIIDDAGTHGPFEIASVLPLGRWDPFVGDEEPIIQKFDPTQPRDEYGRWASTGAQGPAPAGKEDVVARARADRTREELPARMSDKDFESRKAELMEKTEQGEKALKEADDAIADAHRAANDASMRETAASNAYHALTTEQLASADADPIVREYNEAKAEAEKTEQALADAEAKARSLANYKSQAIASMGVDYWQESFARTPEAVVEAKMDEMRGDWVHIGGPGPTNSRWAAAIAFGLGEDEFVAWDAKQGKAVPWDEVEDPGRAVQHAALMRQEYLDTQADLEEISEGREPEGDEGEGEKEEPGEEPPSYAYETESEALDSFYQSDEFSEWESQQQSAAMDDVSASDKADYLSEKDKQKAYEWAADNEEKLEDYSDGEKAPTPMDAWKQVNDVGNVETASKTIEDLDKTVGNLDHTLGRYAEVTSELKSELLEGDPEAIEEADKALERIQAQRGPMAEALDDAKEYRKDLSQLRAEAMPATAAFIDKHPKADELDLNTRNALDYIQDPSWGTSKFDAGLSTLASKYPEEFGALQERNAKMIEQRDAATKAWSNGQEELEHQESVLHGLAETALEKADIYNDEKLSKYGESLDELRDEFIGKYAPVAWANESDAGQEAWTQGFYDGYQSDHSFSDYEDVFKDWAEKEGGVAEWGVASWAGKVSTGTYGEHGKRSGIAMNFDPNNLTLTRGIKNEWDGYVPNFIESYSLKPSVSSGFGSNKQTVKIDKSQVLVYQGGRHWRTKGGGFGNTEMEFITMPRPPFWRDKELTKVKAERKAKREAKKLAEEAEAEAKDEE